jgi:hypothetical protein
MSLPHNLQQSQNLKHLLTIQQYLPLVETSTCLDTIVMSNFPLPNIAQYYFQHHYRHAKKQSCFISMAKENKGTKHTRK